MNVQSYVPNKNGEMRCPILSNGQEHFVKKLFFNGFWDAFVCEECFISKANIDENHSIVAEKCEV